MSNRLNQLKKSERDLRDIVSNLLNTEYTDGLFHLIKFNNFIHEDKEVKKIIKNFDDPNVDLSNYVLKGNNLMFTQYDKPIDDALHYKYILKYISQLIEKNVDLKVEFAFYKQHQKFNDAIQSALKDIITPLYSYIRRELIAKIEIEENKEKEDMKQKQSGDIYYGDVAKDGGVLNKAGRDIDNKKTMSVNQNEGDVIQGDNNKIKKKFYQKEGFWSGVISGIIVGLACWGIEELIKYLIGVIG